MPEIDRYEKVLSLELRAAWPVLADAVKRLPGSLVGGTALATVLQHRQSFDLDYMTPAGFSGKHLARKLKRVSAAHEMRCEILRDMDSSMHAEVNGVVVQVFAAEHRGRNPGYIKQLAPPSVIDGLNIASLPDLLAMKLDLIMYRPKLRDYLDIVAIDQSRLFTIEEGLSLHAERYGTEGYGHEAPQILRLLIEPGKLSPDRVFDPAAPEALAYLKHRAEEITQARARRRTPELRSKRERPLPRPIASVGAIYVCNAWMPVAETRCQLPKGHQGHHRSSR